MLYSSKRTLNMKTVIKIPPRRIYEELHYSGEGSEEIDLPSYFKKRPRMFLTTNELTLPENWSDYAKTIERLKRSRQGRTLPFNTAKRIDYMVQRKLDNPGRRSSSSRLSEKSPPGNGSTHYNRKPVGRI